MLITKEIEIDMGHRVPNHKSKCRNPHGHRYKIEVGVDDKVITTPGDSSEGMVIDFGDLKEVLMSTIDKRFDHTFVVWERDDFARQFEDMRDGLLKVVFVDFIPTAENLAMHWFKLLATPLKEAGIRIHHVKVWETPTSTATYEE